MGWFDDTLDAIADGIHTVRKGMETAMDAVDPFDGWVDRNIGQPVADFSKQSMEGFFSAWKWTRDNAISQPVSTFLLQTQRKDGADFLSAAEWSRTWRAAEHVSPGQAFITAMQPWKESQAEGIISSPLRYLEPQKSYLPADWDQYSEDDRRRFLKEAGMPSIANKEIEHLQDDSWFFKYVSGAFDFGMAWFADPLIIAGKGIGAARRATTAQRRPKGGWEPEKIEDIVNSSKMGQLIDFMEKNADNPILVNNTDMALKSAMGPRLGAINAILRTPEERADFIRVGMGDMAAKARLEDANALARQRIQGDSSRLAAIELTHARQSALGNPRLAALAQKEMDRLNEAISADAAMVGRYEQVLSHADEIDEINLSRWSFARAEARTEAQTRYLARPARGGSLALQRGGKGMAARQFRAEATPIIAKVDPATGRGMTTPVESGFVATRLWGVGDFFTTPVTLVRMMKNAHPNGYLSVDQGAAFEAATMTELRAQVARIPGIRAERRQDILNQWLKTTDETERVGLLRDLGNLATAKIAAKHGLSPKMGMEIYEAQRARMLGEIDNMQQFTAATVPREGAPPLRADAFETEGGIKIAPHTVTRIMNSHILPDLKEIDRTLARHSSALRAIYESHRTGGVVNSDWILSAGEYLNHLWKFATLFRLGYIPRTAGDDLASQAARLGAVAMAARAGYGINNTLTNISHRLARPFNQVKGRVNAEGVRYAEEELKALQPEMLQLRGEVGVERLSREQRLLVAENRLGKAEAKLNSLPADAPAAKRQALERFIASRRDQLSQARARAGGPVSPEATMRLRDVELRASTLEHWRDEARRLADEGTAAQQKAMQGADAIVIDGVTFPSAFGGQRGDYFMQRIAPSKAYDQLFKTNKQLIHANLMRSFDHGARPIAAIDDEVKHAQAWARAINAHIANDEMQRMFVAGASEADVAKWLKTDPRGKAYWTRLNLKMATPEDIAMRARHEVDEYLPLPEIRMQALAPEGVTPEFLTKAMKIDHRPTVHMANVGQNPIKYHRAMDRIMQRWYDVAANLPAARLSRHPLFNQLYEGHLKMITAQRAKQGAQVKSVADVEHVTEIARRLAERDTKRLVFDIAHRSDAAAALRFVSPFFSATAESFQRWGRVIADRPETLGYAANFYNAPAYMGWMQDQDGNRIMPDGHVYTLDPKTGKAVKKLASKADRFIVGRMPKWLIDSPIGIAFGVERSSGNFSLSQNSLHIVTQGDPWFSPGVGPIVQIPVNEFVKDKPSAAEMARHLGILPYGPASGSTMLERAGRQAMPATLRHFLTAFDTSDYRYQQVKMQIMQRAIYDHTEHGKRMLTPEEINDRARNYWFFSAASAFVQPMATQRKDSYQFWRDQYNVLRKQNPETADLEFLNRFGEEYFIFAQSMSKNVAGVSPTRKAVELSKQYADILAEHPELGALIIGPEGNGPFSPEAYSYQLNTPLVPGDPEMQRRRLTASEALEENARRKGWAKFTAMVNWLDSQAVQRGLTSLEDDPELAATKKAFVEMLAEPMLPTGEANPYYNEAWSRDWFSFDARKYERMVPALGRVATEVLKKDPERSDMRSLLQYLEIRKLVVQELASRPFSTLGAQANADLREAWAGSVGLLRERSTDFADLHSRYLARDLGVDIEDDLAAMKEGAML